MIEAGLSNSSGHTTFTAPRINQLINRTERLMFHEDEWPLQHFEQTMTALADQRFHPLPSGLTLTNIETVDVSYGQIWLPVTYGIGSRERSAYNENMRALPAARWEVRANDKTEFEIWPVGSQDQTLLFSGKQSIGGMVEESDTCTLDADVLVLRVAAQILARDRQEDAAYNNQLAAQLTQNILKAQGATKRLPTNTGLRRTQMRRPGIDFIPPGYGS